MSLSASELIRALPVVEAGGDLVLPEQQPAPLTGPPSLKSIPVHPFKRLSLLGGLEAKIAVAYALHWIRGWFQTVDRQKQDLAETHFRSAVKLLDSMGYMRGAVMKVGQTLASFPDVVPKEFVETLESLHFQAPPMHFSLLRELFLNEFGEEPQSLFAEFDETAFAAASLGQVHKAKLKTGETVAVKIQYPGIGRTIRTDFKNLVPMLLPIRLSKDWDSLKSQVDFLRQSLEQETNYEREADFLTRARKLFFEEEGIIVPKVYPQYSTGKVLTMDYLPGLHLAEYLKTDPSQEDRNEYAGKIMRACARMIFRERILNVDCHPGNYLFMPDGRLGLIDFGCMLTYENSTEWDYLARVNKAIASGNKSDIREVMRKWGQFGDVPDDDERLEAFVKFGQICWRPYHVPGPFDYGDAQHLQEAIDLFAEMAKKRYVRSHHTNLLNFRWECGQRMLMYRLAPIIDPRPIMDEEIAATGWNREDWNRS